MIKRFLSIFCVLFLFGCVPQFDNNEYSFLTILYVNMFDVKPQCTTLTSDYIQKNFVYYAQLAQEQERYRDSAGDVGIADHEILTQVIGLRDVYIQENNKVSGSYCQEKINSVLININKLKKSLAKVESVNTMVGGM